MKVFVGVRSKTWAYLMDNNSENKKAKGTKKCIIKKGIMVKNQEDCMFDNKIILKSQQVFRSDHHNVYTVEINKIALISNDDKRLRTLDRITTYPHGTNVFKVCESKMMIVRDLFLGNCANCMFYDEIILQQRLKIQ